MPCASHLCDLIRVCQCVLCTVIPKLRALARKRGMMIYMLKRGFYEQNIRRRETERERAQETIENVKKIKFSCTNLPRGPREESKFSRAPRRVPDEKINLIFPRRPREDSLLPRDPRGCINMEKLVVFCFTAQNPIKNFSSQLLKNPAFCSF